MISSIKHKQSISWTFLNDAMAFSAKEMPKNHTDYERFAAALSCIQTGILTLLFPLKRRRSSPSPFISHRVLEAVASWILKSLLTSTSGLSVFSWEVTKSCKHPTRSDFEPLLSFLFCDCAGRYAWFSCSKIHPDSYYAPVMRWTAEKIGNMQSVLREVTSSCDFVFFRTGGQLRRGRLFFLMRSEIRFVWLTSHSLT